MTTVQLRNRLVADTTTISNEFIDKYMVSANGEDVKIYLYILRLTSDVSQRWTLSTISEKLEVSSRKVMRALAYWKRQGLLEYELNEEAQLNSITILDPEQAQYSGKDASVIPMGSSAAAASVPAVPKAAEQRPVEAKSIEAKPLEQESSSETVSLSKARVKELKNTDAGATIQMSALGYLGRPLKYEELETLLFFYDKLQLPVELIDYLLEYCAGRNQTDFRYITKVGFAWEKAGITTLEEARDHTGGHSRIFREIMKAYGLSDRKPATAELNYMRTWLEEYGMSRDMILEAVNRTILQKHKPIFSYTDAILKSWKQSGASTLDALAVLDSTHSEKQEQASRYRSSSARSSRRSASDEHIGRNFDYESIEKQLLGY